MDSQRERREERGGRKAPASRAPRESAAGRLAPRDGVARPSASRPTAVEAAITMLGLRALTAKALRDKLTGRYDDDEIEAAMVRLRELGLVDDAAWASRYAADRFARTGKGRHRIRAELLARGIDREAAEAALASLPAGPEEREKAAAVLATLRRKTGTAPFPGGGQGTGADSRLFRRMIARGWPASLVRELLGEAPG